MPCILPPPALVAQTPAKHPALRLSGTKNLHFAGAPFPRFSAKEKLQERIAKLSGGVAVIKVGAVTEIEMKEKKARVEESIVPGGGVALVRAQAALQDLKTDNADRNVGIKILRRAIEEPLGQIATNAGVEASVILAKVQEGSGSLWFQRGYRRIR